MTISDLDEKRVRDWLEKMAERDDLPSGKNARTILALLDRPTMPGPDEVPYEVLNKMSIAHCREDGTFPAMRAAIKVLHDWRTKPAEPAYRVTCTMPGGVSCHGGLTFEQAIQKAQDLVGLGRISIAPESTDD